MSQAAISCIGCKHALADSALFCPNCGRPKLRNLATDALLGQVLGDRFHIQARIGYGGSGIVYRAEHVALRRKVAIKVLHEELSRDELALERFRREATTVTDIENDHIVKIYDFGRTADGRLYLAMELLEGESLDAVLVRERRLSFERTADILIQVGRALMEAHAIGYIHRDIRPRNIYLAARHGRADFVKLLDFGLAKLVENDASASSTTLGMRFGDPRYMSPEQASGDRVDRRSDVYQLGCVAYEMLTGTPPFVGDRVLEILTKQVVEIPKPVPSRRPDVPLWMEAACAKLLAKDPMHRFVTATRMIEALERGLQTGEVMTDDDARQREAILPASVSRVMERMGVPEAYAARPESAPARLSQPANVAVPTVTEDRHRSPQVSGERGTVANELQSSARPEIVRDQSPVRDRGAAVAAESPESDDETASASDSMQIGESARWYEEGERSSREAELAARERARKLISPSVTDMSYWNAATSRRGPLWIVSGAVVVTAVILIGIRYLQDRPAKAAPERGFIAVATAAMNDATPANRPVVTKPETIVPAPLPATPLPVTPPPATPPPATPPPAPATLSPIPANRREAVEAPHTSSRATERKPRPNGARQVPLPRPPSPPLPTNVAPSPSVPPPIPLPSAPLPPTTPDSNPGVSGTSGPLDPYGEEPPPAPGSAVRDQTELDALVRTGEVALSQRQFAEASARLRRAAQLAPTSTRVHTLLGEAYAGSGQYPAAADAFKKALQLDPDNARARLGYEQAASKVPPPSDE